jgi:hypothetical protein
MLVVCVVVLVEKRDHLSAHRSPGRISRRPRRPVRGLPAGALHVHRLGERTSARRGVPRPKRPCRERSSSRSRSDRPLRLLRLRDRHRFPLRRLLDRALLGPVPDRGRPLSRWLRRSWPGWPGSSPCSPRSSPARTRKLACSSTAAERASSRRGSAASSTRQHAGERAAVMAGAGLGIIGIWWISHLSV